jgi:hypothetical protein
MEISLSCQSTSSWTCGEEFWFEIVARRIRESYDERTKRYLCFIDQRQATVIEDRSVNILAARKANEHDIHFSDEKAASNDEDMDEDDQIYEIEQAIEQTEKKKPFERSADSNNGFRRNRFRNFSHVSEFANGLDVPKKLDKNKDKLQEFLESKRQRNTDRRLFGRKKN